MALHSFITQCEGTSVGAIEGEHGHGLQGISEDFSKAIQMIECNYGINMGTGAHGGPQRSHRVHTGFTWLQEADKSFPKLLDALKQNDVMEIKASFCRQMIHGQQNEVFKTVHIEGGRISRVVYRQPNTLGADTATLPPLVEVTAVYRKITVEDPINSYPFTDDWQTG